MDTVFNKYSTSVRILVLRYRLRRRLMDLQALSAQQIADFYLGDALLGEIRSLQERLNVFEKGESRFSPRAAHSSEVINELKK